MNYLEKLAMENKENYQTYLKRMTDSFNHSTKGIIPLLTREYRNILDVGCGSGVMMQAIENVNKKAKITGVDINKNAIEKLESLNNNWTLIHSDFMKLKNVKFDSIIFSSILHEISSYHQNPKKRFTSEPIYKAFVKANELLTKDGCIILRDGLLVPNSRMNHRLLISFINPEDREWLYRFYNEFQGFNPIKVDKTIIESKYNEYCVSERFLKEFLYTYTWGPESYPREINERFGILTKNEWINLLKDAGFRIDVLIPSPEEYEEYLKKRITITELDGDKYEYPDMTILIKASKVKSIKK